MKADDYPILYYVVSLPASAKPWLEGLGVECFPMPQFPEGEWVVAYFGNEVEARHYMRRWNGRVGKNYRASLERKAVSQ